MAISLKAFHRFLKERGLVMVRNKGGHEIWDYPNDSLLRPVIVQSHLKDVPKHVVKSNLRTLGVTFEEFEIAIGQRQPPKEPKT